MPIQERFVLGVIMLDTKFKRVIGDIGNPASFDFPVLYHRVEQASVQKIVSSGRIDDLLPAFVAAAQSLQAAGATAITTSCGFLTCAQQQLAQAVKVPLLTSSLFLVPQIHSELKAKPLVIVTANRSELTPRHLEAAGILAEWDLRILGMEHCPSFKNSILSDGDPDGIGVDPKTIQDELIVLCHSYLRDHAEVAGFVFECTNLQPYADAVAQSCRRPVWGINDVIAHLKLL